MSPKHRSVVLTTTVTRDELIGALESDPECALYLAALRLSGMTTDEVADEVMDMWERCERD